MAISIYLGNVSKKKNSTFVPSLNTGAVNVHLKDGTSDTNPSFTLNSANPITANYLRWGDRYYFIDDIEYTRNDLYTLKCSLDVLATYKSYIQATTAFVAYDTTANTELTDSRISIETTANYSYNEAIFGDIGRGVCAVVTITGRNSTSPYAMEVETANSLLNSVNNWLDTTEGLPYPDIESLTDVLECLKVFNYNSIAGTRQLIATGNVTESIKSAILLPVPLANVGTYGFPIRLGNYNTGLFGAKIVPQNRLNTSVTIPIPWQANDWRRNAPYHEFYLFLPCVGVIPLSPSDLIDCENIICDLKMSYISGDAFFIVRNDKGLTLGQYHTNLSSPFAIGSSNISPMQAVTAIGSVAAGVAGAIATSGASAVISGTAGIMGVTNNLHGTPATIGANGGGIVVAMGASEHAARLVSVYHDTNVTPDSVSSAIGTPTMAVKSLANLSGYVECRNASVSAPAESGVIDQINNYLNNGIFIE